MRVKVTEADWREALCRRFLLTPKRWAELQQEARQVAAERLLKENSKRTDELLRVQPGSPGWRRAMDEFDRLSDEHQKLLDIAYPRARAP